jgi:hypothetical protein
MNGNDRDLLIKAAFGELEAEEQQRLDNLVGSEKAAAEHKLMSQAAQDLKRLNDVPECQLTSEHLRDAILAETPKSNSRALHWPWMVGAAGAAAAVWAVALMINTDQTQPFAPAENSSADVVAMIDEPAPRSVSIEELYTGGASISTFSFGEISDAELSASIITPPVAAQPSARAADLPAARNAMTASADVQPEIAMAGLGDGSPIFEPPALESYSSEEDTMIVISNAFDGSNGSAVEVSRSGDVVFGG